MPSKTRSQLALDEHDNGASSSSMAEATRVFSHSPVATKAAEASLHADAAMNDENNSLFLPAKRSSSTAAGEDGEGLQERVVKRVKHLPGVDRPGESSNYGSPLHASAAQPLASTSSDSKRSLSTDSAPSPKLGFVDIALTPRARSIPTDGPIPHLDLTRVPPSPWRSPSKSKGKEIVRTTSIPPADVPQDVTAASRRDADGDIRMDEGLSIGSDIRLASPRTPAPALSVEPKENYLDIEVAVKAHDGQAGLPSQVDRASSHTRTPSSASRLPRPSAAKATASSVQQTLYQAFTSGPRSTAVPPKGLKARMKPKNPSNSSTPTMSSQSTPTPNISQTESSEPAMVLKSKPIVATQHAKVSTSSTSATSSRTSASPLGKPRSKTPALAPRDKTPSSSFPMTPSLALTSSLPKTPATIRQRSKSAGPSTTKIPARAHVPMHDDAEERGRSRAPRAASMKSISSRPNSPARVPSPPSTVTSVTSEARSPEPIIHPRGRSPTPRGRSSMPSTPSRLSSLSPLTGESREGTPERRHIPQHMPPEDDLATPKQPLKTSERNIDAPSGLPELSRSNIATHSSETPEPSTLPSPNHKGKRKVPLSRQASMPPMTRVPTRSSLRLKENKKNIEPVQKDKEREVASEVRSKAGPSTGSNPSIPSMAPTKSGSTRKRAQSVFSFARPTESSAAKASPVKRPPPSASRFPSRSMSRPPESMTMRSASGGHRHSASISSLSNLSMALEKFNTPVFSRPNTSLGFSRDQAEDSDTRDTGMDVDIEPPSAMTSNLPSTASGINNGSKVMSYQRAATVGPSIGASSSASRSGMLRSAGAQKQSALMGPPPVPKCKTTATVQTHSDAASETSKPRINLSTGIISGQPKGKLSFGNSTAKQRIFGVAPLPSHLNRGTRVLHRASKQTTLPTVEGSPAKGGGDMAEADEPAKEDEATVVATPMEDLNPFASGLSGTSSMLVDASRTVDTVALQQAEVAKAAYGGGSLRASKAFRSLTPFTVESPQTTPRRVPASEGKGKGRAVSSTFPSSSAQTSRTAPMIRGTGVGAHVARPQRSAALASPSTSSSPAGAVGSNTGTPTSANGAPQSSGILKGCVVFVDVKSEEGLDVSSLFTEMLQQLGAKILARVGQSCTHIVYKNGLASTSNRWRALNDPKPLVVGIAWVVACAERKEHVDEQKYLISMADENIAGTNKRRKSFLPKNILESPERPSQSPQTLPTAGDSSGGRSHEVASSPASEGAGANNSFEHLPPLERVRRRQSALFNPVS